MKSLNDVNKGNDVKNQPVEEMKAEPEKIDFSKVKIEPLFEEAVDFDTLSIEVLWLMVLNSIVIRVPTVHVLHRAVYSREKECLDIWEA